MKTKLLIILLITGFTVSTALAQGPERFQRWGRQQGQRALNGDRELRENRGLNLSDEQKESIKEIRLESAKELKPLNDQLRELNAKHQTLMTAENPDMGAINQSLEEIGNIKLQISKIEAKQQVEIRGVFNEEQLLKADKSNRMIKKPSQNLRHQRRRSI